MTNRNQKDKPGSVGRHVPLYADTPADLEFDEPSNQCSLITLYEQDAPPRTVPQGQEHYIEVDQSKLMNILKCPICLGVFKETVGLLSCIHRFCNACITPYLSEVTNNSCPICRSYCSTKRHTRTDENLDSLISKVMLGREDDIGAKDDLDDAFKKQLERHRKSQEEMRKNHVNTAKKRKHTTLEAAQSDLREAFRSAPPLNRHNSSPSSSSSSVYGPGAGGRRGKQHQYAAPHGGDRGSSASQSEWANRRAGYPTQQQQQQQPPPAAGSSELLYVCFTFLAGTKDAAEHPSVFENLMKPYIRAPAHASVGNMKLFVVKKFGLSEEAKVRMPEVVLTPKEVVVYVVNKEQMLVLTDDLTLEMVAHKYWDATTELKIFYAFKDSFLAMGGVL